MPAINQKQEHTGSYYAASVNEVTGYPVLEGSKTADVCVIGGGFTGVATALSLAERGYSVALVEANRIGWGASGRNGGQLINGISGLEKIQKKHGKQPLNIPSESEAKNSSRVSFSFYQFNSDIEGEASSGILSL